MRATAFRVGEGLRVLERDAAAFEQRVGEAVRDAQSVVLVLNDDHDAAAAMDTDVGTFGHIAGSVANPAAL